MFFSHLSLSWEAFPNLNQSNQLTSAVWLSVGEMIVFGSGMPQAYGYGYDDEMYDYYYNPYGQGTTNYTCNVEMFTWPVPMAEGTAVETPKCAWRTIGRCPVQQPSSLAATRCHNRAIVNFGTSTYIFLPPSKGLHQGQWTHIANANYYLRLCYSLGHLFGIGMLL